MAVGLTDREREDQLAHSLELSLLAIGPSIRTHHGTARGDRTNTGQHGQPHHEEHTSPDILESVIHAASLLFVAIVPLVFLTR